MTTHTTRPHQPVTTPATGRRYLHDHIVTGTSTQLDNIIANHRRKGTFVDIGTVQPLPDGRHRIILRLYDNRVTRPTVRVTSVGDHARTCIRRSRRTRIAVIVTAVTGTIAGIVAVAAYLIGQLVELITTHAAQILGVLALTGILAALAAHRTSRRRHCPGC